MEAVRITVARRRNTPSRYLTLLSGLLAALFIAAWVMEYMLALSRLYQPNMGHDFSTMYCAAQAWLRGAQPYTSDAPRHIAGRLGLPFIYVIDTPATLLLYAPFTLLPPRAALVAFAAVSCVAAAAAAYLTTGARAPRARLLVMLGVLATPALFLTYYVGQTGAFVALLAGMALWARRTGQHAVVGAVVATACALKPQLGLCVAVPLLWGLPRRAILAAALTGAAWMVVDVLVLTPGGVLPYIDRLQWFSQHAATADAYDGLGMASLYLSWTPPSLHPSIAALSTILVVAGMAMLLRRQGYHPTVRGLAAATALATLLLPYSHHYDAVALTPALLSAWDGSRPHWETAVLGAAVLVLTVAPLIPLVSPQTPVRLVPIGLMLLAAASLLTTRAPSTR